MKKNKKAKTLPKTMCPYLGNALELIIIRQSDIKEDPLLKISLPLPITMPANPPLDIPSSFLIILQLHREV